MKLKEQHDNNEFDLSSGKLLILCCHCIYDKGQIISEFQENRDVYQQHLIESVKALSGGQFDSLIISGGFTKPNVLKSEAQGMLDWAHDLNLAVDKKKIILEEYARDSFENVLFSVCRFYDVYKKYPNSVTVCSWKAKERRFAIIANALKIPNYAFFGIAVNKGLEKAEAKLFETVKNDPFFRSPELTEKRQMRDPWKKGNPYGIEKEFQKMFTMLDYMEEKHLTDTSQVQLPWE